MTGISYITNEKGKKTAVVIDLIKLHQLWEDFYDKIMIAQRKKDTRIPIEKVKKRLQQKGIL